MKTNVKIKPIKKTNVKIKVWVAVNSDVNSDRTQTIKESFITLKF